MSQVSPNYKMHIPKQGDFKVDNKYIFEVGGKSKGIEQIKGLKSSWVVKDDTETPVGCQLPLWMFGLLY